MGLIVNGHDGTYQYFEGYYWYHAAEYGLCKEPPKNGCDMTLGPVGPPYPAPGHCGFQANHNVSIWRSKSLRSGSWEFVGRAASCAEDIPNCEILYRPHVVFNPSTRLYVLFVNYVMRGGSYKGNAVFTASNPAGPFTLRTPQMHLSRLCAGPSTVGQACGPAQGRCGDFDVVVDPSDGAGYIIYSCNHLMSIERLTPDYLQGGGTNSSVVGGLFGGTVFPENLVEAPAFFHRDGMFYALFGHCCCFCYQGSGVMVYTARSPAGPWEPQCSDVQQNTSCLSKSGDLACVSDEVPDHVSPVHVAGSPSPGQGCNYKNRPQRSSLRAQQNFVISVGDEFIWTGDRWQQSPDGLKGHEGQTWIVLSFDAAGRILPLRWQDVISFDVPNENVDALIV
eukprot:TRINITY_DN55915_c0_g1_i2.p1 TRINITY_DN55915_c0_g1~~TRINITY_DN55915_c0_g1_i2.p1  ORF type:complete len:444 (+),score=44.74 TRINITY_DN55915_c0_g1_i2:155-1333(+)